MATRRILSIDGGGVRGVFSAAIIEQMEIETGKRAWEIFDCFVGTSAGSILAAGLAADISAEDLKNTFTKLGEGLAKAMRGEAPKWEDLTPDQKEPLRELCGILYEGTAPDELPPAKDASLMLASILKTLFQKTNGGDKYPRDLKKRLAVVTRNMKLGKVVFFGNFPADQLDTPSFWDKVKRDDDTTLRNLSTTMGHSSGLIREQSPVWWGSGWAG